MSAPLSAKFPNSFFRKSITSLVFGVEFAAFMLLLGNGGNVPWLPPAVVFSIIGIFLTASLLFPLIWHFFEKRQYFSTEKIYIFFYGGIRYFTAFNLASFGWKKFYGLQFVVPREISDIPMNQQTGEWLTWFYFGYSESYGIFIALIQIIGSSLLLFRKTLLLGALILFALLFNLTIINICYGMNAGALLQSVLLTIGVLFLIIPYFNRLCAFISQTGLFLHSFNISRILKNSIRISVLVLSLLFTIYLKSLLT
jgi:hypothetical protein